MCMTELYIISIIEIEHVCFRVLLFKFYYKYEQNELFENIYFALCSSEIWNSSILKHEILEKLKWTLINFFEVRFKSVTEK